MLLSFLKPRADVGEIFLTFTFALMIGPMNKESMLFSIGPAAVQPVVKEKEMTIKAAHTTFMLVIVLHARANFHLHL